MAFVRRKRYLLLGAILVSVASLNFNWSTTLTFSLSSALTDEEAVAPSGEIPGAGPSKNPTTGLELESIGEETTLTRTISDIDLAFNNPKQFVAIVACIRSVESWKSINDTSIYNAFLPSIWPSITDDEQNAYRIEVVLAFDEGDKFWESPAHRTDISTGLPFAVNFISVANGRPNHIPFNELCRSAYEYGADYIVRVNDDTQFVSSGWITKGVDALASFQPPHVGVVGPTCRQGNTNILTHDMVHRTHLDIFDDYYPDEFDNWYVDNWISKVYGPTRTKKVEGWVVKHLVKSHGTRYRKSREQKALLLDLIDRGSKRIDMFLTEGVKEEFTPVLGTPRIAMVSGPMEVASSNRDDANVLQLVEASRLARDRNPYGRYAVIQFLDEGRVTETKNWICNVRRFGVVLSVVTFIAIDMEAYRQIREFDLDLNVIYIPFERPSSAHPISSSQIAYHELMSLRTNLLYELLRNDIGFMIVESDAVWKRNVLLGIYDLQLGWKSFDVLSGSDKATSNGLQGGFLLNLPTPRSITLWGALHQKVTNSNDPSDKACTHPTFRQAPQST